MWKHCFILVIEFYLIKNSLLSVRSLNVQHPLFNFFSCYYFSTMKMTVNCVVNLLSHCLDDKWDFTPMECWERENYLLECVREKQNEMYVQEKSSRKRMLKLLIQFCALFCANIWTTSSIYSEAKRFWNAFYTQYHNAFYFSLVLLHRE